MYVKQSTSVVINFGPFLDKTDGVTLETGLVAALDHATTGIMLSKNGGVLAVRTAGFTATSYDAHGCYRVTLGTVDTGTLGQLRVIFTDAAVNLPVWLDLMVMPANVYDSMFGADALDVSVIQWLGTGVVADFAGRPQVTIKDGTGTGEILTTAGVVDLVTTVSTAINVDFVGALNANAIGAVSIQNGAITAPKFGAGAIDATVIADGAIDAATLASDVAAKIRGIVSGTSDSGTTTTMVDAARTEAATDYWKGCFIEFTSGTISGEVRLITGFNASTDTITFAPATTAAVSTQTYTILPAAGADVRLWNGDAPNVLIAGRVDVNLQAMATGVISSGSFAAGAIDAAAIAANAIGASELATDAVAEIQAGLATAASITTLQADTDDIQTRLPAALVGGRMDSDVEAINNSTEAADDLQFSAATMVRATVVADGGNSTTQMKTDLAPTANDHYKGRIVIFTSSVLADQATSITTYSGATKILTFPALTSIPAAGTTFVIV